MTESRSRFVALCQQALACAVVAAVAVPAVGVASLEIVAPDPDGAAPGLRVAGALVASEPVEPDVREVPLEETTAPRTVARSQSPDPEGLSTRLTARASSAAPASAGGDDEEAVSGAETVRGFGSVGVTWDGADEMDHDEILIEVRTLDGTLWSPWQEMHYDDAHSPEVAPGEDYRAGTDAVVVGDVDDVQVRATTRGAELPSDMRLSIVDPGRTTGPKRQEPAIDTARLSSAGTSEQPPAPEPVPAAPDPAVTTDPAASTVAVTAPQPQIFSRAQWGADERMRDKRSLRYGTVKAGFVHHTVNANDYSADQVPAIIRGIYAYHTQSRGWSDVGYNFLVDRFGRIWEGRYGGVDRAVVGAHTLNYNEQSFAMSAIGNFETAQPSSELLDAYGRLFAWKLGLHGVPASKSGITMNGKSFRAINGHRDAGSTACPGRHLYAKLGTIRQLATSYQGTATPAPTPPPPAPPAPVTTTPLDTNISGSEWPDFVVRDAATQQAFVVRTGGQPGFSRGVTAADGFAGMDKVVGTGDLDGDGLADLLARSKGSGVTTFYKGNGAGQVTAGVTTGRFKKMVQLVGVGDLDGDGRNDVVGKKAGKQKLLLFRGKGNGTFKRTKTLANPWTYRLVVAAGDANGDKLHDLFARDKDGRLWLLRGDGAGGLKKKARKMPGSWDKFDVIAGFGDLTNDGRPDLLARLKKSGRTYAYPVRSRTLGQRFGGWTRFAGVRRLVPAGELNGPGVDLAGVNGKGRLVAFPNRQGRPIEGVQPTGVTFADTTQVLTVGDFNRDGHKDVITRSASTGDLLLRAGNGADGFAEPVLAGSGFGSVADLRAVGDVTGDGVPDLAGTPSGKSPHVFPGNGTGGFGTAYAAKGPKNLARLVASKKYDWVLPIGNLDGNGRRDVLVRARRTGTLWLLPGIKGGFDKRQYVASGFGGFDLAG